MLNFYADNTMLVSHNQDFHEIIVGLFKVAKRDGIITESEASIIENVKINIEKFSKILMNAEEDGYIDARELDELTKMKEMIELQAYETALIDNIMTKHEDTLLKSLSKLLNKYLVM